jgi:hypothetical protein
MLYATDDWTGDIPAQIADVMRELSQAHFVTPAIERMPWLGDRFRLRS